MRSDYHFLSFCDNTSYALNSAMRREYKPVVGMSKIESLRTNILNFKLVIVFFAHLEKMSNSNSADNEYNMVFLRSY